MNENEIKIFKMSEKELLTFAIAGVKEEIRKECTYITNGANFGEKLLVKMRPLIDKFDELNKRLENCCRENQTAIEAEKKKIRADEKVLWKYMSLFNVLKDYFPEEETKRITETIVNFAEKDTLILIGGEPGPTGKTTLCKKLNSLGFKAKEVMELPENLMKFNYTFFAISLNEFID